MKRFKRFLATLRQAYIAYQYDYEGVDENWTDADSLRLAQFFNSETGLKLKARMTNYVLQCACYAVQQGNGAQRHCGVAQGVSLAVQFIERQFPERQAGNTDEIADQSKQSAWAVSALN